MEIITILGRRFWAKPEYDHSCKRWNYRVQMELNRKDFIELPWERLNTTDLTLKGDKIKFAVEYPNGKFYADDFSELREMCLVKKWEYQNPIAAEIHRLRENRNWHERHVAEIKEKINKGHSFLIVNLRWDGKRNCWQGFERQVDYNVVYTINERYPRPNSRRPGKYYCKIEKGNVVHHEPKNGRRGFKLHVVVPHVRAYNTDEEIQRLMPRCETTTFPESIF